MKLTEGTKYDQGKLRWDLVPPEIEEFVKVLTYGATKYEDRNWEKGINYGRLVAATLRHLYSWIRGEQRDPETGLHHLAHAICDLVFLLTYELRGMNEFDDRSITNTRRSGRTTVGSSESGLQPDFFAPSDYAPGYKLDSSIGLTPVYSKASRQETRQTDVTHSDLDGYNGA